MVIFDLDNFVFYFLIVVVKTSNSGEGEEGMWRDDGLGVKSTHCF